MQDAKQKAYNDQTADSSAESTQCCAQNTNAPVRIKSDGDDGNVKQANLSGAISAAGNKNDTTQNATQDAGSAPRRDGGELQATAAAMATVDPSCSRPTSTRTTTSRRIRRPTRPRRVRATATPPSASRAPGGGGNVTQFNGSLAASAAGNENSTDQSADQSAGGSGGGVTVQALGQKAVNGQEANSHATSEQDGASNDNSPVRIKSAGGDGDVTQANLSGAFSVAGNSNDTTQSVSQDAGSGLPVLGPLVREGGCGSCGGDGATVQGLGQWASSKQSADSSADSTQNGACNTNSPVRIKSRGDDGDVKQVNASAAKSAAGNDNQTTQSADQAAGWGGVNVQALGQKAWNGQGAHSDATSQQYDPSNANAPVRIHSTGGGGSVLQANASLALSAAGNRNSTCQVARQGSGGLRGLPEGGARAGPRDEGGLTARLWPRRPVLGGPAGGPPPPLTHPNGWVSGCRAGSREYGRFGQGSGWSDMGASAHLALGGGRSGGIARCGGAGRRAASSPSPDAAPSGSSAPRPDPAPVKTKPRVVVRAAPRPAATATTTVGPAAPAATATPTPTRDARRAQAGAAHDDPPGDLAPPHAGPSREARGARRAAAAPAPGARAAQRTPDDRRRRPRAQARRSAHCRS